MVRLPVLNTFKKLTVSNIYFWIIKWLQKYWTKKCPENNR